MEQNYDHDSKINLIVKCFTNYLHHLIEDPKKSNTFLRKNITPHKDLIWVTIKRQNLINNRCQNAILYAGKTRLIRTIILHFGWPGNKKLKFLMTHVTNASDSQSQERGLIVKYLFNHCYMMKHPGNKSM